MSQTPPAAGVPTCYRHPGREAHIRCQRCDRVICPECMRPAAVGFQCPECVAEGAKSTRASRTTYGGLRPTDASVTSMVLIAVNVAVWIALTAVGGFSSRLFDFLALRPNGYCAEFFGASHDQCTAASGTWAPGVADGAVWQLLTSMVTQVSFTHLLLNGVGIWLLGPALEAALGRARFLALYLVTGLTASAAVMWLGPEFGGTHGASGAFYGMLAAALVMAYKSGGDVQGLLIWVGLGAIMSVVVSGVSWQGHLGGFLGGLAAGAALIYAPRGPRRTQVQVAGVAAVALVAAVAIVLRCLDLS